LQDWLLRATGLPYDQRNAVVVGLAMGFAVIPVIFAIAEDAFSNVPKNLIAGSLALGATRWQTMVRVVLPTASPGIFSAVMIGFGRAVGETMIVLMATGNTPILQGNPFNGFRTLSANIAVEIPEAPVDSTLYRVLFLAALLLFLLTFTLNTGAELVRQRLRKKYAQL
jgi:phosphate transport system permease protein